MTTQKQFEANRENAKLGGVKTEEGKAVSKEVLLESEEKIQNPPANIPHRLTRIFSNPAAMVHEKALLNELESLSGNKDKLTNQQEKRKSDLESELSMLHGLRNGIWVASVSYTKYSSALAKMRHDILIEYDCKTSLEIMLADRIVASYWRAFRYEMTLNRLMETEDGKFSFDQLKVNILKEMNRGLDFANRQLHTNMILLKDLKQPPLNVKVKAENAFIAQNQQINAQKADGTKPYETIDPK